MVYIPDATKAATRQEYLDASVRIIDISGRHGEKTQPFSPEKAIEEFQSWAYIASMINARQLESVPLRLFVRSRPRAGPGRLAWQTRKLGRRAKRYLAGDLEHRPSKSVLRKILEFGIDDYEEVTEPHPVTDLLRTVNPWFNGFETGLLKWVYLQMTGNAYQHIVTGDDGLPAELWTMPAQWTKIIPGEGDAFIEGYVYGAGSELETQFDADEVIHYRLPNPTDLFYGRGFMEAAWSAWTLETSNRTRDLAQERNMGRPDYLIICKAGTTPESLDRFEKLVQKKLRGSKNAGNMLTITGDVELVPLAIPDVELGSADKIVEEIGGAFGVPVSMLKANFHVAGGQANVSDVHWLRNTIAPLLQVDEEKLNEKLVGELFGLDDAVLAYDDVVPQDKVFDRDRAVAFVGAGIETRNEVRQEQMLDPSDDPMADQLLVNGQPLGQAQPLPFSLNMQTGQLSEGPQEPDNGQQKAAEQPKPIDPAKVAAIVAQVQKGEIPRDSAVAILEACGLTPEQAEAVVGSAGPVAHDDLDQTIQIVTRDMEPQEKDAVSACISEHWGEKPRDQVIAMCINMNRAAEALPDPVLPCPVRNHSDLIWKQAEPGAADDTQRDDEPRAKLEALQQAIQTVLDQFGQLVLDRIGNTRAARPRVKLRNTDIEAIIDEINRGFQDVFVDNVREPLAEIIEVGGTAGVDQLRAGGFDGVFDVTNPAVDEFISNHTLRLAGEVQQTTLDSISRVLREGLAEGASPQTLAQRIEETGQFSPARAEAIARTESATAYVEGEKAGWRESGVVRGVKWLLAANPCEFCAAIAKQFEGKQVGLDEHFAKVGDTITGVRGGKLKLNFRDISGPPLHPNCRCDLLADLDLDL